MKAAKDRFMHSSSSIQFVNALDACRSPTTPKNAALESSASKACAVS
jgi:hypothetical protein